MDGETSQLDGIRQATCRIYATVPSGFEFAAKDEAHERFGKDMDTAATHTERGALRFSIPISRVAETVKLRAVDHLYVVMLETKKTFSATKEEALKETREMVGENINWKEGFAVWKILSHILTPEKSAVDVPSNFMEGGEYVPAFRATCYRSGKHSFSSQEAMAEFGGQLHTTFNWTVNLKNYDVDVVLIIDDDRVSVCLALTNEPLFRRNITFFGPTTLRATIAYSMVRMGEPKAGDVVCDPMCGSGSIPIEAALGFSNLQVICGDNFLAASVKTMENVRGIERSLGIPIRNVDAVQWDLVAFPLRSNTVDVWVSDFPFGKRHKCNRRELYPRALIAMARASKPGVTRAVILTKDRQAMAFALKATQFWYLRKVIGVNIGGLNAWVYSLFRTTFNVIRFQIVWIAGISAGQAFRISKQRRFKMSQHVFDMLAVDRTSLANEPSTSSGKKVKSYKAAKKIPKGMSRELFSIMAVDGDLPEVYSTIPSTPPVTDSWKKTVHRDKKRRARKWLMTTFQATSRQKSEPFLSHWCKAEDADKEYPFAKLAPHCFAEPLDLPAFTREEFAMIPTEPGSSMWSEDATRHLMDLVSRYDLRFEVIQYVWNEEQFGKKDCVDLRARFTEVYNFLVRWRGDNRPPLPAYDAATERKRRIQLSRLQMRTQEEIDEHIMLKEQERKIRMNKDERERRQGIFQQRLKDVKARTQTESSSKPGPSHKSSSGHKADKPAVLPPNSAASKKSVKKSNGTLKKSDKRKSIDPATASGFGPLPENTVRFPEIKGAGIQARSLRLKLPNAVSSKKATALKIMLNEIKVDEHPMASEEVIDEFNQLRTDLLSLYDLKGAIVNAQADLVHLKVDIGDRIQEPQVQALLAKAEGSLNACSTTGMISSSVDVAPTSSGTRYRRRQDHLKSH
ncbi:THUMP domain-containing protein 3 [Hypsibius exemplaris]|uniref:THUMP domain-containing protein 3 n=1 Tax=Hypsibius exemplaris TaxID=2072580 RepID=A0A1W0XAF6_HYPEX|nr:THUMP domain-containing protein 3 [Hypsibius exemplaris]